MKDYILVISGSDIDYFYDVEAFLNEGEAGIALPVAKKVGGCVLNVGQVLSGYQENIKVLDYLKEDDIDTDLLLKSMKDGNLDINHILFGKDIENGKCLIMKKDGEKCIYIIPSKHPEYDIDDNNIKDLLFNSKLIYTLPHTYIESFGFNYELLKELKEKGIKISFDGESQYQNNDDLNILKYANYIFMNKAAYHRLESLININPSKYLLNEGVEILCVTDGNKGITCYTRDKIYYKDAIKLNKILDSTGAGDTFAATFIHYYLKDNDIEKSLEIATYASARACLYEGGLGGVVSEEELNDFIKLHKY